MPRIQGLIDCAVERAAAKPPHGKPHRRERNDRSGVAELSGVWPGR